MRKSRPKGGADPLSVDTSERRRSTQLILVMRGVRSLAYGLLLVLGLPFILAGMLKSAYDCSLWMVFRRVHLEEEQHSPTQEPARPGEVTHALKDGARMQTDDGRSRHR